jgi:RNA polymerase sigma-70 factor (ECF subfamily)
VTDASQDLVAAARDGDRAALEELLRIHHDRIYALARRITGNDADAADATQEALLAIVRGLPRFDGRSSFSTWAYRVTSNACLDELRRRRRRPAVALADAGRAELADPTVPLETTVPDRMRLDEALRRLPEDFRVAVVLRDVCDLDYAEIATVLDLPPGTVRSRIARGRAGLASLLGGNHPTAPGRPSTET